MNLWRRLDCIYADRRLGATEKLLAGYLAFRADQETMRCRVGAGTIGRDTGLHRRTVERAVAKLEVLGLLSVERPVGFQGSRVTNAYTLKLSTIAAQNRYSQQGNSGAGRGRIAAQSPSNSGTESHSSDLNRINRAPDGGAARESAPPPARRDTPVPTARRGRDRPVISEDEARRKVQRLRDALPHLQPADIAKATQVPLDQVRRILEAA